DRFSPQRSAIALLVEPGAALIASAIRPATKSIPIAAPGKMLTRLKKPCICPSTVRLLTDTPAAARAAAYAAPSSCSGSLDANNTVAGGRPERSDARRGLTLGSDRTSACGA